eukprot:768113-Hanusia_phi.AAC.1
MSTGTATPAMQLTVTWTRTPAVVLLQLNCSHLPHPYLLQSWGRCKRAHWRPHHPYSQKDMKLRARDC